MITVCGGRDYANYEYLNEVLELFDRKVGIKELHHGDARGAGRLAGRYARENGIPEKRHPANRNKEGKAAGLMLQSRL